MKDWTNGGPTADARAREACTPKCTNYDWEQQMYGRIDPTWETVLTATGGLNNTRFYASIADKQESGIMLNTGSRRTGGRINLDQSIGQKLTVSGGLGVTRNFLQRGVSNNDNAGISPVYLWGYTPHIIDLRQRDAAGNFVTMPFNGGGSNVSNPFQTMAYLKNNEQVWRQTGNVRVGYAAFSRAHHSLQFSYLGGVDRFQQENVVYSPNFLQYEPKDGFVGTSAVANTSSWQFNQSVNAVWNYTPSQYWLGSLTTSAGFGAEEQDLFTYRIQGRGLLPTVPRADGGAATTVENPRTTFRDQSYYVNSQAQLMQDKLTVQAGVRADRSSANGDREQWYAFPKFSAAYRLENPRWLGSFTDEMKVRAAFGRSGNRPRFGDRDVLYASGGIIGGSSSLVSAGTLGNPSIKPETMQETELGLDVYFLRQRLGFEVTNYRREIKEMLLTFPLPPSSGLGNQIVNGGQLSVAGWEIGINAVPYRNNSFTWTSRITTTVNRQMVDTLPVPAFAVLGSFGATYGRNRIVSGQRSTWIWANAPLGVNGAVRDTIIGDSNAAGNTQFVNELSWKNWSVSTLIDWRNGGLVSDMTWNLWDEGGQSRDFDDPSPKAGMSLGEYRYDVFAKGDSRQYIEPGTYVKFRELTITWNAPADVATKLMRGARDLRVSFGGRNLFMWSKYWAYDPEFNNFGNTNFNRFLDLAPFPSSRQMFLSVDVGF